MKRSLLSVPIFFLGSLVTLYAEEKLTDAEKLALLVEVDQITEATQRGNADVVLEKTHPAIHQLAGGKEAYETMMRTLIPQMAASGIVYEENKIGEPGAIHTAENGQVCFVPKVSTVRFGDKRMRMTGFLIAAREKAGADWLFVDGVGLQKRPELLWELFPGLAEDLELPENKQEVLAMPQPLVVPTQVP